MLFFAIVYVVEGIGQARVGIIFQPLNYYLKVIGWTPLQVTAYLAILNFPWVIKPVFGLVSDLLDPSVGVRRRHLPTSWGGNIRCLVPAFAGADLE